MRGQDFDNGANIKGENNSLQSMLLKVNPRAFLCLILHKILLIILNQIVLILSLNFTTNDALKVNLDAISLSLSLFFSSFRCK